MIVCGGETKSPRPPLYGPGDRKARTSSLLTQSISSPDPSQDPHADCLENIALGLHISPQGQHPAPASSGKIPALPPWLRFMADNIQHWQASPQADHALAEWAWQQAIPDAVMQQVAEDMSARLRWTGRWWTSGRQTYINLHLAARGWARMAIRYAQSPYGPNQPPRPSNGRNGRY